MPGDSGYLEKLIERVADGQSVDWDVLERDAPDEEARLMVRHLRLLAEVGDVHRSQVDNITAAEAPTVPAAPGDPGDGDPGRQILPPIVDEDVAWGHLRLVKRIGEGSFGEVFHAHDTWLDHPVALKLLKREAEARVPPSQLLHEARKLARVRHINVVSVHGADRHNGRVGFWMEYVDGETLASRVGKGRLSAGEAVSVGQDVCRALAAVHQANLIHRDVKAQNVMRAHDGGRIVLMDFGAGQFIGDAAGKRAQGTPLYLAPELLEGGEGTVRSDIYAVGVLLYHLVTGRFPVDAPSQAALIEAHRRGERRRLRDERADLPDSFIGIVERALEPDPQRRYGSAGDMEAKLSGEPSTRPIPVVTTGPPVPSVGDYARRAAIVAAAVVALTAVLGFIAARFFEVVLHIDREFWLGPLDTFAIGINGIFPYVILWLFGAAVLVAFAALRTLFGKAISRPWERLVAFLDSKDPLSVATGIFLFGAAAWIGLNLVVHRELYSTLYALQEDPMNSSLDVSILGPASDVREWHLLLSVYLSMLLGLAVWRWFPKLEGRSKEPSTIRLLKWGTVAVAFIVVAWDVMPRRVIWETYPRIQFEKRMGLVIGSVGENPGGVVLLYFPEESERPRRRVPRNSTDLKYLDGSRSLFGTVGAR
jgi:serine/threonine-protein kinase